MGGDQLDLLDYPRTPGWQTPETSIEAAERIAPRVTALQARVLEAIRAAGDPRETPGGGLTADEAAYRLGLSPFTSRPRVTELHQLGLIVDSEERRVNESGNSAIVWVAACDQTPEIKPAPRKKTEADRRVARVMKEEA